MGVGGHRALGDGLGLLAGLRRARLGGRTSSLLPRRWGPSPGQRAQLRNLTLEVVLGGLVLLRGDHTRVVLDAHGLQAHGEDTRLVVLLISLGFLIAAAPLDLTQIHSDAARIDAV